MGKMVHLLDPCTKWPLTTAVDLCPDLCGQTVEERSCVQCPWVMADAPDPCLATVKPLAEASMG